MVLYHRPSGTAHVVTPLMLAILEALDSGAQDAPSVLAAITAAHDLSFEDDGTAPVEVISARLDELAALGLIDEVP